MTMYYYLIPIATLFVVAIFGDTQSASPLASRQVKDICVHMTKTERGTTIKMGALYGLCLGVILGTAGLLCFKSILIGMTVSFGLLLLIGVVLWPRVSKWQRSFLASTEWARSEGIEANDIKLFRWEQE